jgi:thymidylate synthase (FAD)
MSETSVDYIKCLDHGYVKLIDVMPHADEDDLSFNDQGLSFCNTNIADYAIIDAARVSYQVGTKRKQSDKQLLRYLMRHWHTSPFEMVEFKFEMRLPIFVMRQLVRHRTASLNEESARYSVMEDVFYEPDTLRAQSTTNKQGSAEGNFNPFIGPKETATAVMNHQTDEAYKLYQQLIEAGVSREQARMVLPVNLYTRVVWKCDLLNLLKMLRLRLDSHAQYEIRVYAEAIAEFVKLHCPWTWEAFEDYWMGSETFSKEELKALSTLIQPTANTNLPETTLSKGELEEFKAKLNKLTGYAWKE